VAGSRGRTYLEHGFQDSLRAFRHRRVQTRQDTERTRRSRLVAPCDVHTATTLGREATVLSYARRIADHEAQHMDQLQRTVKRQGGDE
jgi:hypothetical protein